MNKLIVVNKPVFISSNSYLNKIKRKYKNKKAGFSGTLDPFACGCLIVAFGQYPKLFRYLKKTPKKYRATIWLDVHSDSLDIENITHLQMSANKPTASVIQQELDKLVGTLEYLPPKYSAKKIDGKRAYTLAREAKDFEMKKIKSTIYDIQFVNYNYPFITFDITVSEGSYIRSIAQVLLENINQKGTLSYLQRVNEGEFFYDDEKELDPTKYLNIPQIKYTGTKQWFELGKKLNIDYFCTKDNGEYLVIFDTFFAIVEIKDNTVKYILNKVMLDV
jgi:tRNA pseudouridine55 synthase